MPLTARATAALSLSAAMALTGANVAFGKAIAAEVSVYVFVLFRFAVASAALALLVRGEPGPKLARDDRRAMARPDPDGAARPGRLHRADVRGLRRTAAADAGIITAALPAVVAVLGVAFAGDRLSRPQLAAVGLAVAGLLLVQATGASGGMTTLVGNLLVAGAVLCEASFVVLGKRLAPPYQPLRLSLGANSAGAGAQPAAGDCRAADLRRRCREPVDVAARDLVFAVVRACSACGCGIAACPMWRPGSPAWPPPPSRWRRWRPRRCTWARRSAAGGWRAPRSSSPPSCLGALASGKGSDPLSKR